MITLIYELASIKMDTHTLLDIISACAMVGWVVVGLLIKSSLGEIKLTQLNDKSELISNQGVIKEELIRYQTKIKEDLITQTSKTDLQLAVHIAQDEEKFRGISSTLTSIDNKLDKIHTAQT